MNTFKKMALLFGVATGAAVTIMALSKSGKKTRNYFSKIESKKTKQSSSNDDDSEMNYV